MSSQSTTDGAMQLTITFKLGTDLDKAQVLVQNRVAIAEPRLSEEVRRVGVTTVKSSPDLLLVVHLMSPDESLDQLYIGNYALIQIRDTMARIDGVGDVSLFGLREYSMRVWLDPERLAARSVTTANVLEPEQFENVVIKRGKDNLGRITRLRDVARIELGALDCGVNSYLDNQPAVGMAILQRPGDNALATADAVIRTMEEFKKSFPKGLDYQIAYNPASSRPRTRAI